jgi:NAD(P)-dependent dehydrogenase (short-subunit alcohol dehydrogenase family)
MEELEGKVALVTGASRGVGAATAIALAQAGCDVAVAARSTAASPQRTPGTLDGTVAAIEETGRHGLAIPTNLADDDEVVAMVETAVDQLGRLDILINNAAVTFVGDLNISLARYDLTMQVNLRAPLIAMRQAIPHMRAVGGGAIINVSSMAANYPVDQCMAYGVSKIGLERMSVDVARQVAEDNIAVNVFRIDLATASEGFIANTPGLDHSNWEPPAVPAEGILWMLRQPASYTGQRESMNELRHREHIMASQVAEPWEGPTVTDLVRGISDFFGTGGASGFEEPYPD